MPSWTKCPWRSSTCSRQIEFRGIKPDALSLLSVFLIAFSWLTNLLLLPGRISSAFSILPILRATIRHFGSKSRPNLQDTPQSWSTSKSWMPWGLIQRLIALIDLSFGLSFGWWFLSLPIAWGSLHSAALCLQWLRHYWRCGTDRWEYEGLSTALFAWALVDKRWVKLGLARGALDSIWWLYANSEARATTSGHAFEQDAEICRVRNAGTSFWFSTLCRKFGTGLATNFRIMPKLLKPQHERFT